jgi:hypothetical protein
MGSFEPENVMFCTRCGKENAEPSAFCSICGAKLGEAPPSKKRQLSRIAGILDIASAGVSLVVFLPLAIWDFVRISSGGAWMWLFDAIFAALVVTLLVGIALSVAGGVLALQRRNWGWAIAGASAATAFGIWPLGVAALILTAISRDEFSRPMGLCQDVSPETGVAKARRLRGLKPLLIATAAMVVLVAVIVTLILILSQTNNSGDIEVFAKRASSGKEAKVSGGGLKTLDYTDFALVVKFDGSVTLGDQENSVETHFRSGDVWSDKSAEVQVFAQEGSIKEVEQPGSSNFFFPEQSSSNRLTVKVEILDQHQVQVSPSAGGFPAGSQVVLSLDYGDGSGYIARVFTAPSSV